MFKTNAYDKTLRPAVDQHSPTALDVAFHLMSINKIDELDEKLVSTAYLTLEWKDEFLTWDAAMFPVYRLPLPQNIVWKPDFVLKNGFTAFKELGGSFYYVMVTFDGTVTWKPYQVFESQCSIDVTYFPFDTQTCNIVFTIWSHYLHQVQITSSGSSFEMDQYKSNSIWDIISTSQVVDNSGSNSVITYTLKLRRKPAHFVGNIIVPILFLGTLNILVFVIPADAGEKMSYSTTVALGFMVFLTIVSSELPANSESTPYLSSYLLIQIIIGGFSLIVSSLQLRLRHRDESQKVNRFLRILVKFSLCRFWKCQMVKERTVVPEDVVDEKNYKRSEDDDQKIS
ncbi:neuronal acetylcholine receptor subunit alpha-6-like [Saccostrea echinata]|uniref:neuronal acetylcholine receptor subunit alpha-6-like n=1 Tax=Saccostrea echinata TaxID=191078 RepID=UPI002A8243A2|nr:neuronal acetylcholine receptor subunit alpha-6-like [Saccostrea echinata]